MLRLQRVLIEIDIFVFLIFFTVIPNTTFAYDLPTSIPDGPSYHPKQVEKTFNPETGMFETEEVGSQSTVEYDKLEKLCAVTPLLQKMGFLRQYDIKSGLSLEKVVTFDGKNTSYCRLKLIGHLLSSSDSDKCLDEYKNKYSKMLEVYPNLKSSDIDRRINTITEFNQNILEVDKRLSFTRIRYLVRDGDIKINEISWHEGSGGGSYFQNEFQNFQDENNKLFDANRIMQKETLPRLCLEARKSDGDFVATVKSTINNQVTQKSPKIYAKDFYTACHNIINTHPESRREAVTILEGVINSRKMFGGKNADVSSAENEICACIKNNLEQSMGNANTRNIINDFIAVANEQTSEVGAMSQTIIAATLFQCPQSVSLGEDNH